MPTRSETYRLFIASPSDLAKERQAATEAVHEWNPGQPQAIIAGVFYDGEFFRTLQDWQVLCSLNEMAGTAKPPMEFESEPIATHPGDPEMLGKAEAVLRDNLPLLDLPFPQPADF